MSMPPLSGALEGLKVLECSDLPRYKAAVSRGEQLGFCYFFPYLWLRNHADQSKVLVSEDDGSFCVFLWRIRDSRPRLELLVAPTPMNAAVLKRCLERANEFNGDYSARVLKLDEKDVEVAAELPELRIRERKPQYLYAPKHFADISGRKFRTLRRNVTRVRELPDLEVLPYSREHHLEPCRELLRRWRNVHRDAHGTAGGVGLTRRLLERSDDFSPLDLHGEVVMLNGRLSAFAFGGEIRPGVGCFFEAKADTEVAGLSYFHRYSFLEKLQEFQFVNDGSDVGRAGLRQLKNSLRPVEMHVEYRANQEGR